MDAGRPAPLTFYAGAAKLALHPACHLSIGRFIGVSTTSGDHVYASEYHLHHFNLELLRESAAALPKESVLKKVPAFLYPVHLLAVYDK